MGSTGIDRFYPKPGCKTVGSIKMGNLPGAIDLELPILISRGTKSGPTLVLSGGVHGEEVMGTEIVRRIFRDMNPDEINGTLIGVPIVNIPAFAARTRRIPYPMELYPGPSDMNRSFPGKACGTMTERYAYAFFNDVIMKHAEYVVDLHTDCGGALFVGGVVNVPPESLCKTKDVWKKTNQMARIFGGPAVNFFKPGTWPGILTGEVVAVGIPAISAECGAAWVIDEGDVEIGVRGVKNIMKFLGIVKGKPELPQEQLIITDTTDIYANHGGFIDVRVTPSDFVSRGDIIAEITSLNYDLVETIIAPKKGYVLRVHNIGSVSTGDQVISLANEFESEQRLLDEK